MEKKNRHQVGYLPAQYTRYNRHNIVKLLYPFVKDKIARGMVRLKGNLKVMSHQIFGFIVLLF